MAPARSCRQTCLFLLALLSLVAVPSSVFAQSDPRIVEFQPSADHNRQTEGVDVVDRYALEFYAVGSGVLLQSIDMGKPAPDADGLIRFEFASRLGVWQVLGVTYEARVVAVGPGGAAASAGSNPFDFPNAPAPPPAGQFCWFTLTPPSIVVATGATSGSLIVSTAEGCNWTAVSSAGWLTITNGTSGVGTGTVGFSAAANPSSAERIATIRINSSTFTLSQNGGCGYVLSPTSQGFNPPGGTGRVTITAPPGCAWTAVRAGSWITITSGTSGSGDGAVNYRVSANGGSTTRTGTLTIAGQPVVITQSSATAPNAPAGLRIVIVK
jgi:hypothetical protein